ncbi:Predicted branched-chain amino acid permease (azaleucine resistance) [Ruminococcaceae bacterium YAD3003]|nr:Predicted branched-chain amino acid permease (azaleucine resistance) [Ruminococcaceae bacterium YAD3003]
MPDSSETQQFKGYTLGEGVKDGLPIGLGYLSVSFTFGILAVSRGLSWLQASLISLFNITSAGQVAGLGIMTAGGGIIAMIISQIVINLRYSLMGIALSQKADKTMTPLLRILLSFAITDEIFGVAVSKKYEFGARYFFGLTILPVIGWVAGTTIGAILGRVFPDFLTNALAIGIYGMFVSIVLPKAKHDKVIMTGSLISCIISCVFFFTPVLAENVSGGFAIIIAAVVSALIVVFLRKQVAGKAGTVTAILAGIFLIVIMVFMAPVHKEQASSVAADVSAGKLDNKVFIPLLLVMALTTYLVRMIPFVLFRKKLERPSVKAFFDYIPYTVLSAMTFPAILYATGSYISALVGFIVSLVLGFFEKSLLTVAIGACVASLVTGVIVMYI